jgi:hypothetical protein
MFREGDDEVKFEIRSLKQIRNMNGPKRILGN